jgi:hypothetical protein
MLQASSQRHAAHTPGPGRIGALIARWLGARRAAVSAAGPEEDLHDGPEGSGAGGHPYEKHEALADFHAAGRQSQLIGLGASGASIKEAEETARYADTRQTICTDFGLRDLVACWNQLSADVKEKTTALARGS